MCATNTRTSPLAPRISKCPARVRGEPHPERDFGPLPRIIISIIPKPGLYIHVYTHTHTHTHATAELIAVRRLENESTRKGSRLMRRGTEGANKRTERFRGCGKRRTDRELIEKRQRGTD